MTAPWQTGLVSVTFRQLTPAAIVALVAKAKQTAIEWGGDVHVPHGDLLAAREVGEQTRDAGLETVCYGSYYRLGVSEGEGLAFQNVLDTAVALDAPAIRVWAGNRGTAQTDATQYDRVVADGRRIADLAQEAGRRVVLEFHANTLTDSAGTALRLQMNLSHPAIRLLWQPPDTGHAASLAALPDLLPHIAHLHVFYWTRSDTGTIRHSLADGEPMWREIIATVEAAQTPRLALIEFVSDDSPEQYEADAGVLRRWIQKNR